jgi:quercetin dioxygenase-like cupin family protein
MKVPDQELLPPELLQAMLGDVAAQLSGPTQTAAGARIRRKVLQRVAPAAQPAGHDAGWRPLVDKAEMKILFDDGVHRSWLVRMQPGGELPPHAHEDGDEECVVLEGEVWVDGRRFGRGDYTVALRGSRHESVRTETGVLFFLRSPSPRLAASRRAHQAHA